MNRIQAWLATHPVGAASLREAEPQIGSLIGRADAAMYVAKRSGRTSFLTVG